MPHHLDSTYGGMLIGALCSTFLQELVGISQGILTFQSYLYFDMYSSIDPLSLKLLVAVLWSLDFGHLILVCQSSYHYLITNFGNDEALLYSTIPFNLHIAILGVATIICQLFFLKRIWVFSDHNMILTGVIGAGCLSTFALDIVVTVHIIRVRYTSLFGQFRYEIIAMFSGGALVDLVMALTLIYYLRLNKSGISQTDSILSRIIRMVIISGLATSIIAIGCLIAFIIDVRNWAFIALHFTLGRMYTNALLATLNSRNHFRQALIRPSAYRPSTSDVSTIEFIPTAAAAATHLRMRQPILDGNSGDQAFPMEVQVKKSTVTDLPTGINSVERGSCDNGSSHSGTSC